VNPSAFEHLLIEGAEAEFFGWTVVAVEGRHRERFLNSQLTSDVQNLAVDSSQPTALLDRSGRLRAHGYLLKREERIELLVPTVVAEVMIETLEAFVIADDVVLRTLETPAMRLVLGPEALRRAAGIPREERFPVSAFASRGFVIWSEVDLGLAAMETEELESLGILSEPPRWETEIASGMLLHETALLETAVSFDKGCYLGQETVAKMQRGRGAAFGPMLLEVNEERASLDGLIGERFAVGDRDRAGQVRSVARWNGVTYLYASVARELRVDGREIACRFENASVIRCKVHNAPLLRTPEPEEWAERLSLRAVKAFAADREDEAIGLFERALAVCPSHADSYESLGVLFGRHRRYEEAIALMQRLLEVDPLSVMAHTNLSLYYNQLGRIEDAEREAGEATRARMLLENQGRQRMEEVSRVSEAADADRERRVKMFRQVLELDPADALGNFGLGELLVEEERFVEAAGHLERALVSDPHYSAAFLALGRAHEGSGCLEDAGRVYRNGIEVAAARGDLLTANRMQERLLVIGELGADE
jgi:folate-binding protein YgfZ